MKKIIILMLFSLLICFVNAQKPKEPLMLEKLNLQPIESIFDEQQGKIYKETKVLRANLNEYFKSETNETNEIALSYLQAKRVQKNI